MLNKSKFKKNLRNKRHRRVRAKIKGDAQVPRFSVFRSNRGFFLQLIDDEKSRTLLFVDSIKSIKEIDKIKIDLKVDKDSNMGGKMQTAYKAGVFLGQKARDKKIKRCVFDRGGNKYHGRVKAVADGARSEGLIF